MYAFFVNVLEPTNNMNLEGMTFFHEKPKMNRDEKKSQDQHTRTGEHNLLHAFSVS